MHSCQNLESWLSAIAARHTPDIHLGLERISVLAEKLQVSGFECPVITVGGTNGKGTTVGFLQHLYTQAGYRVGSYFSPHLHHFTERVQLNNQPIDEQTLCLAFQTVSEAVGESPLTFFEFITLSALVIFKSAALDVILLEVGLGGRLDAVNCVDSTVAIITQIALDHCERLGNDREAIGFEKAGIFRKNKAVICGDPDPPYTVRNAAQALNCDFYAIGKEFSFTEEIDRWSFSITGTLSTYFESLPLPKIPLTSVACGLMAASLLVQRLPVTQAHCLASIINTALPGRFEVIQDRCPIIFDVAHNGPSAEFLAHRLSILESKGDTFALFSHLDDKECESIVRPFIGLIDEWHVIPLSTPRAAKPEKIVRQIKALFDQPCYNHPDVTTAWAQVSQKLHANDRLVVFGSFYTVAAVQNVIKE